MNIRIFFLAIFLLIACDKSNISKSNLAENDFVAKHYYQDITTRNKQKLFKEPFDWEWYNYHAYYDFERAPTNSFGIPNKRCKYLHKPKLSGNYVEIYYNGVHEIGMNTVAMYYFDKERNEKKHKKMFIALRATMSDLIVFDSLHVGCKKEDILNVLGEPQISNNNLLFFHDDSITLAVFKIEKDTIQWFELIRLRNNVNTYNLPELIGEKGLLYP